MLYNCNCLDEQNIRAICLLNAETSAIKYCGQRALHDRTTVLTVRLSSGSNHGGLFVMAWEVDWTKEGNTGTIVWARNPTSHQKRTREWHWTTTGYLRENSDINTPEFRADSWEVDWNKRDVKNKKVWARNSKSKMPSARKWHWIQQKTLSEAGIKWKPAYTKTGRHIDANGYVVLTRIGMTDDEIKLAEKYKLFKGKNLSYISEHRLVAAKKYNKNIKNMIVRHINGIKTDNRPENLVLGTTQENTADHNTARIMAMYWHNKYDELKDKTVFKKQKINTKAQPNLFEVNRPKGQVTE